MSPSLPPETLYQILRELSYSDLRSCVLVNHIWSITAIQLLWKNPFAFRYNGQKNYRHVAGKGRRIEWYEDSKRSLVDTYIWCLSDEAKHSIKNTGVEIPSHMTKRRPNFNYPSILTTLNFIYLSDVIGFWLPATTVSDFSYYVVFRELCKMFMTNSPRLKILEFSDTKAAELKHRKVNILPLICYAPGAKDFFSRIVKITCHAILQNEILYELALVAQNIEEMNVQDCNKNKDAMAQFIQSQTKLRKIEIEINGPPTFYLAIEQALESKAPNLTHLSIVHKGYSYDSFRYSLSWLVKCEKLQELKLHSKTGFYENSYLHQTSLRYFRNLKKLEFVINNLNLDHITMIKKTENRLSRLKLIWTRVNSPDIPQTTPILFSTINQSCIYLIELELTVAPIALIFITELFLCCKFLEEVKLHDGRIRILGETEILDISEHLIDWGSVIPRSLRKLIFRGDWSFTFNAFRNFMEGCDIRLFDKKLLFLFEALDSCLISRWLGVVLDCYISSGKLNEGSGFRAV
ncbi:24562_t:CDS:2 [Dentiscutata erythropus]|uniref:24562_t:CDS:1 n=1 Tax=Dentiscutata erythropus TaxID=1348616 RepID=A0A9N8VKK2_9GLOM|nr:24562_t:CDS:2 [Dentiscutata erythropus]